MSAREIAIAPLRWVALVRAWLTRHIRPVQPLTWPRLLAARVALYAALGATWVALADAWVWIQRLVAVAVIAVSFVVGRWFPLSAALARRRGEKRPLLIVLASATAITVGGAIVVMLSGGLATGAGDAVIGSAWTFAGLAAMFLGLGLFGRALRTMTPGRLHVVGLAILGGCGTAYVIGCALMGTDRYGKGFGLVALAVVVLPLSIGLLTEFVVPDPPARNLVTVAGPGRVAVVGGAVLVAAALGLWWTTSLPVVTLVVGAFVLVLLIAMRGDADVILMVVVLALAFASAPPVRSVESSPELRALDGVQYFVAIGDSYMSGEGADEFYAGTNTRNRNECRRAPSAYAPSIAVDGHRADAAGTPTRPAGVMFLACSGAVARQLWQVPQTAGDPVNGPAILQADGTYRSGQTQLAQLTERLATLDHAPAFVLVSIGGNDANFGELAQSCVLFGNCTELAQRWIESLDPTNPTGLRSTLATAYDAIRSAVPKGVPIAVVPYPNPLKDITDGSSCAAAPFTPTEVRFLRDFTSELDAVVAEVATAHGFHVIDPVADAFAGAQICDDPSGAGLAVNGIRFRSTDGLPSQLLDPTGWLHNSMHPTAEGHQRLAHTIETWLDGVDWEAEPTTSLKSRWAELQQWVEQGALPSYCTAPTPLKDCATRWKAASAGDALRSTTMLLSMVLLVGAWLVACALIHTVRRLTPAGARSA